MGCYYYSSLNGSLFSRKSLNETIAAIEERSNWGWLGLLGLLGLFGLAGRGKNTKVVEHHYPSGDRTTLHSR
jgi:hypothetical protein